MDRLFLDANILFSVSYRPDSALAALWRIGDAALVTSDYVLCEASRNLETSAQRERLETFAKGVELCADLPATGLLFTDMSLPEKDWPVLLGAIESGCTHLLTGDKRHFGPYFGREVAGVFIVRPGDYLRGRAAGGERPPNREG